MEKLKRAFTLIELLMVIAIIAILTIAFLPGALRAPAKARDSQRIKNLNDIHGAIESYQAERVGVVPAAATSHCLVKSTSTGSSSDLNVLSSYFPNGNFPTDPKTSGTAAWTCGANYGYVKFDDNVHYAIVARVELQASGNSSATTADFFGTAATAASAATSAQFAATDYTDLVAATLASGNGAPTGTGAGIPNETDPLYVLIGSR